MKKDTAKSLVKSLASKADKHFAFSTNGGSPFLLTSNRPIFEASAKVRCEEEQLVAYRGSDLYLGEIVRGEDKVVFQVDLERSKGKLDGKKAVAALIKFHRGITALGVRSPVLVKPIVKLGDAEAVSASGEQRSLNEDLESWESELGELRKSLLGFQSAQKRTARQRLKLGEDLEVMESELLAGLGALRSDIQLGTAGLDEDKLGEGEKRRLDELRTLHTRTMDELLPGRKQSFTWDLTFRGTLPPLEMPKRLEDKPDKYIHDKMQALMRAVEEASKSGKPTRTRDLLKLAKDVEDACLDRVATLDRRLFQGKKIAAILEVKRQAQAFAATCAVKATWKANENRRLKDGETVREGIETATRVGQGVNGALIVKNEHGKATYVAKVRESRSEMGNPVDMFAEVGAYAVGDAVCSTLDFPKMIAPTFGTRKQIDNKDKLVVAQELWDAKGDLNDSLVRPVRAAGKIWRVPIKAALTVRSIFPKPKNPTAREEALEALSKGMRGSGIQDNELGALLDALVDVSPPDGFRQLTSPVDPVDEATDLAQIAILDIVLGQRDHTATKGDNLMVATVDGKPRVRPIDFGESLYRLDDEYSKKKFTRLDLGAWSGRDAATTPFPNKMLEDLALLDVGILTDSLTSGLEALSSQAAEPTAVPGRAQVQMLELQARMVQAAAAAFLASGIPASTRDLADLFAHHGLVHLKNASSLAAQGQDITPLMTEALRTFGQQAKAWLESGRALVVERSKLTSLMSRFEAGLEEIEEGTKALDAGALNNEARKLEERVNAFAEMQGVADRQGDQVAIKNWRATIYAARLIAA